MARAAAVCSKPGCIGDVIKGGRCEQHQPKPWTRRSASTYATRKGWQPRREEALRRAGRRCERCGSRKNLHVHHRHQAAKGGSNSLDNLEVLCYDCHGKHHRNQGPFLILVGPSGVGKTTVRELVAASLGIESFGPDDFPTRWREVYRRLDRAEGAVVEAVRIPDALARRAISRGGAIVELSASRQVRAERLRARGEAETVIARRLGESSAVSYSMPVQVTRTISVDESDPQRVASLCGSVFKRSIRIDSERR